MLFLTRIRTFLVVRLEDGFSDDRDASIYNYITINTMTEETELTKTTLLFNKTIISTPQNPIATKDLLIRLQQLSDELSTIDQENPNFSSIEKYKQDLVNPKLLKSNHIGVQAYVCCAISDILRIYAPDAPFTSDDISAIFKMFFNQFKKLADTNNRYFHQQCYLLKRLAEVRSIVLITEVSDSEHFIETIFNIFYDLSKKDIPSRLEPLIADILSEIMSEAEIIPHNVLKMILDKILFHQGEFAQASDIGFNFSVSICESNIDRMSRQVAQYFSEILYESQNDNDTKNIDGLEKVHKLSVQLWNFVPGLLTSVMGLLDDELNADNETIRCLATEAIGKMIGSSLSSHSFIVNYKNVWPNWLAKTLDVSPKVRCKWVEQLSSVVTNLDSTIETNELCIGLNKCLLDTDEKVRLVSCKATNNVPFEIFTRFSNKRIMTTLNQLMREKNVDIRNEAIKILSNQCKKYYTTIINNEMLDFGSKTPEEAKELEDEFKQIPNQILSLIYINDKDITANVDICLFEKILPFDNNTTKRVDRICNVFGNLTEKAKQSFFAINKRQQQISGVVEKFLDVCEEYGNLQSILNEINKLAGTVIEGEKENISSSGDKIQSLNSKADKIIQWLAEMIPDQYNAYGCLERFYKLKNFRFIHLFRLCVSSESDFLTVKNSMKELLVKLSNPKNIKFSDERNVTVNDMASTFRLLLYRGSVVLYNKSNIVEMLGSQLKAVNEIIDDISNTLPDVFRSYVDRLEELINNNASYVHIKTMYKIVKNYGELYPKSQDFNVMLKKLCLEGTPAEAKYSMKLLGLSDRKRLYCNQLVGTIFPLNLQGDHVLAHLSTIGEIFLVDRESLNDVGDLSSMLIRDILLSSNISPGRESDGFEISSSYNSDEISEKWMDHNLSLTLACKLLVVRIFINKLKNDTSAEIAPILKLFVTIINNHGEILKDRSTPKLDQQYLRFFAGLGILKLSKGKSFNDHITDHVLNKLTYLIQDNNDNIRSQLLNKLEKYLARDLISDKFLILLNFMHKDPNFQIINQVTTWVKSMHKKLEIKKDLKFEKSLVRLIHLLSHNPECTDVERPMGLKFASEIIIFYMKNISKLENVSLLYYLASRIKQFRDATIDPKIYGDLQVDHEGEENGVLPKEIENIYMVSELCQLILKELCLLKGWNMLSWPGKLQLPTDLFSPMTSTFEAQLIISKVYLNQSLVQDLVPLIKSKFGKSKTKKSQNNVTKTIKRRKTSRKSYSQLNTPKKVIEPSRRSSRIKRINYEEGSESDFEDDE